MSFKFKKKLPVPKEIKELYPVSPALAEKKKKLDAELIDVITGKSDKFLAIIGPCSADNEESVCEYIERLVRVQEKIKDKVIIIPRIYTNKPRTTGEGYKGMLHQPDPEKAPDLLQGIIAIRKLHMHALETYGMPIADEMLYPENYWYLADILSYVAIGARSVEDQQHRLVTSGFRCAGRHEKSYQRRFFRNVKLRCSRPGRSQLYLPRLGCEHRRQPLCPYDPARFDQ